MNPLQMMKQAHDMYRKMREVSSKLEKQEFEGESGHGKVKIVMTGKFVAKRISLMPDVLSDKKIETLLIAAINDVCSKISKATEEETKNATGGFKLPF